jgi:pimeloyl-ACP methyl ester carboxylesterase
MAARQSSAVPDSVREELVPSRDVELAVRQSGNPDAPPVVVMHGLFATRDYVLMGSTRLEEAGFRVIAYDARGHGRSTAPERPDDYGYEVMMEDLLAVMDAFDAPRPFLLGVSMGGHTSLRLALEQPERVGGIAVVTPSYDPDDHPHADRMRRAEKLAQGIRRAGIEGFMGALEPASGWGSRHDTFRGVLGHRMKKHRDLTAVADALPAVWAAVPFGTLAELEAIAAPTVVVGTRDDYDNDHPHELAGRYAAALPTARLVCEPEGKMPLAWNGGSLAAQVIELASAAGRDDRGTSTDRSDGG